MLYLRWLPVGSCTLLQRGNGWIPLPLFSVCACGAISSDPDPNLKERGIFYASYHYPPPVPESRRRCCCFHSGSRPAEQLRRLVRFRQLHRRLRQQHLHPAVLPSARHPELSDLLRRPGPVPRHPVRGHAGGVRQPRQDPRGSGHHLGVGCGYPDLDLPPAGRELGGLQR